MGVSDGVVVAFTGADAVVICEVETGGAVVVGVAVEAVPFAAPV